MQKAVWLALSIVIAAGATAFAVYRAKSSMNNDPRTVHVILIGASIGQAWRLPEWPARVQVSGFSAEALAAWRFDKSEAVQEVLMRPARKFRLGRAYLKSLFQSPPRKPDIVILKECSSYFPGDLSAYQASVRSWVQQLQSTNAKLMVATVVPVTRARAAQVPGKQESLLEYNRWIRTYAQEQHIPVLDLEAVLHDESDGRYLKEQFAQPDGTHLNSRAYAVLDHVLRTTLCAVTPVAGCGSSAEPSAAR